MSVHRLCVLAAALLMLPLGRAEAADMVSYRARYALSLDSSQTSSGVVGAGGVIVDQWNATCTGWTEEEHYYLHLDYGGEDRGHDRDTLDTYSSFVSWESLDARHFQFDLRQAETDTPYEEIKGEASLDGPGKGGTAQFSRPGESVLPLPAGTVFPAAHTRFLIASAEAGDQLVTRQVFDGSEVAGATQITAVIGPKLKPGALKAKSGLPKSPLLNRPSWRVRLAFFPPDRNSELPDYEESVRLLDNGVIAEMLFDYGDYAVRARLTHIEALHRPPC